MTKYLINCIITLDEEQNIFDIDIKIDNNTSDKDILHKIFNNIKDIDMIKEIKKISCCILNNKINYNNKFIIQFLKRRGKYYFDEENEEDQNIITVKNNYIENNI